MFLIFSGKKGSGKDTICNEIMKRNPDVKMVKVGLADYLKEICINLYNLDRKVCFGPDKNIPTSYIWKNMPWYRWWKHWTKRNSYVTHREFLQHFGSEICRSIDDKCWVNYLLNYCKDKDTIYCVIDCRFPSEIIPLKTSGRGCVTIRLLRNPYNDQHQSELALDNFMFWPDEILDNRNLTIEESANLAVRLFNEQEQKRDETFPNYVYGTYSKQRLK